MDLNKNHMESSSKARSHRSLRTRHQHDHEWNSNEQECHMAYEERISHHCRYPGTTEPCYENAEETSTEQGLKRVKSMSKHCCQKTCSLEELEKLCCRTSDCLKKCYGNRLTEWEDIDKADSSLYRYFDVLVKPHPSRKYKGADKF
uniref:Insulin-like domain-containing protein n=1 Tax=Ditylenchus dipsaci TaxID=166011 RepID=A0A915DNI5_9BILA